MPPAIASPLSPVKWTEEVMNAGRTADAGVTASGVYVGSNFNLLAVTNNPDHYGREAADVPRGLGFTVWPQTAIRPLQHPQLRERVEQALKQYGNIPQEFPERLTLDDIR